MANHMRRQIRDGAATALTNLTTTTTHVFPTRNYKLQDSELPGLRIYTADETIEIHAKTGSTRERMRTLELVVEVCVKESATLDDKLDQIQKEVEIAIDANQDLGVGAKWVELVRASDVYQDELEKEIGVRRMVFEVLYFTAQNAPDVAL